MSKINYERFKRQKIHEPEVPREFQGDRPRGPSKAELRDQAAKAQAEYRKPVSKAPASPPARPGPRSDPGVPTPASPVSRDITIECQCGHRGVIHATPADLMRRKLRCSKCGEEPVPF
jgi:hypothetical protein